jgi:hypothetical protein
METDLQIDKHETNDVSFYVDGDPIMVITSDKKFKWKGQEIEDINDVYSKVCEFFNLALSKK